MGLGWREWSRGDFVYGILLPVIVVLVIVGLSKVSSIVGFGSYGIITGILMQIEELLVIVGVPLTLGLVWNRWAGGASGFLLGSLYALYWRDSFRGYSDSGLVLLAYVLSAMLIGYMAGALNKNSADFKRMVISGVTSATIGGVILFGVFQLSKANVVVGIDGFLLTVLSRTACGAIVPIIAKLFVWYGVAGSKKQI